MIKKKLSSKGGFTMTELLVAMLIISLLGMAVAVGISTAGRAYRDVVMASDASVLSGTLAVEIADELRFAEKISASGETATFTSRRFGSGVSVGSANGRVTVGGSPIVAEKTYTGLMADASVSYVGGVFTVTITILSPGGNQLTQTTFNVSPVSG